MQVKVTTEGWVQTNGHAADDPFADLADETRWERLFAELYARLSGCVGADNCLVAFWDGARGLPLPAEAYGPPAARAVTPPRPGEPGLSRAVIEQGRAVPVEDVYRSPHVNRDLMLFYPTRALLGVPLVADGALLGAAILGFNRARRFTGDDLARAERCGARAGRALARNGRVRQALGLGAVPAGC